MKRFSAFLTLFLVTDLSSKGGHVPPVPPMATPVVWEWIFVSMVQNGWRAKRFRVQGRERWRDL